MPFPHPTAAAKLIDMAYERVGGGTRLYEDVAMPFAIGLTVATGPALIITGLYQLTTTLTMM